MSWVVVARPDVADDLRDAADWYEARKEGLGEQFVRETLIIFDALAANPFITSRKHPTKNIRWRYPERFPSKVIYEVNETEEVVVIAAVLHAARHDRHWKRRI